MRGAAMIERSSSSSSSSRRGGWGQSDVLIIEKTAAKKITISAKRGVGGDDRSRSEESRRRVVTSLAVAAPGKKIQKAPLGSGTVIGKRGYSVRTTRRTPFARGGRGRRRIRREFSRQRALFVVRLPAIGSLVVDFVKLDVDGNPMEIADALRRWKGGIEGRRRRRRRRNDDDDEDDGWRRTSSRDSHRRTVPGTSISEFAIVVHRHVDTVCRRLRRVELAESSKMAYHARAIEASVPCVVSCGIWPGVSALMAAEGVSRLDEMMYGGGGDGGNGSGNGNGNGSRVR